jgi:replication initiation and membrane attachment protein DnaB
MEYNECERAEVKELTVFYSAIKDDNRIGTTHISMYMALFQFYNLNLFTNPIQITRGMVMEAAKINGLATYHKCIKDLSDFGYIQYLPSYNPSINSQVYLLKI